MTTSTLINLDTVTTLEAKATLNRVMGYIIELSAGDADIVVSYDDLSIIAYSLENNLQLRDYLLGLTMEDFTISTAIGVLETLIEQFNAIELPVYPLETVLASYLYQAGNPRFESTLAKPLAREYALAKLLKRVADAHWSPESLISLASELHPKVLAELERTADELVNEDLR